MRCARPRLAAALGELGYGERTVSTALNGEFVAAVAREHTSAARRRPRGSARADAGGLMLELYGTALHSRLLLGTARYPSPAVLSAAVRASGTEVVTVSLRREGTGERSGQGFWSLIRELGVRVLPNTAGCHSVKEAVTTAHMAREVFGTRWIKLEVIGEDDTLQPDVFGLTEAAAILSAEGLRGVSVHDRGPGGGRALLDAGCRVLMPWGAPIGSGRGLNNLFGLKALRAHFPGVPLIIDAGIGVPSHAGAGAGARASTRCSSTPRSRRRAIRCRWRGAFALAVEAGRAACLAGADRAARDRAAVDPGDRHGVPRMKLPRVYPIVDSAAWVRRLAPARRAPACSCASRTSPRARCGAQITAAHALCRAAGIQLVVNDYWQQALELGCDFVHLGQGDLATADLPALRRAGVRLGDQHAR